MIEYTFWQMVAQCVLMLGESFMLLVALTYWLKAHEEAKHYRRKYFDAVDEIYRLRAKEPPPLRGMVYINPTTEPPPQEFKKE